MRIAGIILVALAYIVGVLTITLPLTVLMGGNWPLVIIGEAKSDLPQFWASYGKLIISGIVTFIFLYFIGNWLRSRAKKQESEKD